VINGATRRGWTRVGTQDGLVTSDIEDSSVDVLGWCAAIEWRRGGVARICLDSAGGFSEERWIVNNDVQQAGFSGETERTLSRGSVIRIGSGPGRWTP
jgi:hypothetical protein